MGRVRTLSHMGNTRLFSVGLWQLTLLRVQGGPLLHAPTNPDVPSQFTFPSKEVGVDGHPAIVLMCVPEFS